MIQYPTTELPLPQADYSSKPITNTVSTSFSSGRVRRRRLGYGKYRTAKLIWQLSPEEYDFFCGWWEFILKMGTEHFTIEMATGALFGAHEVLLVGDPDEVLSGYFWRVSCDAVIFSKPELPEYEIVIRQDGTTLEQFISDEEALHEVINTDLPTTMEP